MRLQPFLCLSLLCGCATSPSPKEHLNICLLGRFAAPDSRPELVSSIEASGHVVVPGVTPDVDLVVLGDDPVSEDGTRFLPVRTLPGYADAQARGIEIVHRREVRHRLSLSR